MRIGPRSPRGFTLVELLVVIAIIGILTGFIAVGLPRAIERAKIGRLENTFTQLRTSLTEYFVDHDSYPPAYGYLDRDAKKFLEDQLNIDILALTEANINTIQTGNAVRLVYTQPWLAYLGLYNNRDVNDNFSIGYDTNMDQTISRLEFSPIVESDPPGSQTYIFGTELYTMGNLNAQVQRQLGEDNTRPLVYVPVNKRQARRLASAMFTLNANDPRPRAGVAITVLEDMIFPPPRYDAYVLISVGPAANTGGFPVYFGLNQVDMSAYSPAYYYHVLGMLTYFMATRDAEDGGSGDGELDMDFRGRSRGSQKGVGFYELPDGSGGYGPIIFVGEA